MKRELKRLASRLARTLASRYCKAYPDEKGIETWILLAFLRGFHIIAKPIPMKRELKPSIMSQ